MKTFLKVSAVLGCILFTIQQSLEKAQVQQGDTSAAKLKELTDSIDFKTIKEDTTQFKSYKEPLPAKYSDQYVIEPKNQK